MKRVILVGFMTIACGAKVLGQLGSLPPGSTADGVAVQSIGINAGTTHWQSPASLGAYNAALGSGFQVPSAGVADSVLGLTWGEAPSDALAARAGIAANGGGIRTIFVGTSATWPDDFGYAYSGNPYDKTSFTVFQDMDSKAAGRTPAFGSFFDNYFSLGQASSFDLWLNGVGGPGADNQPGPTGTGGVFTAFAPANSSPYVAPGNVRWAQEPLLVSTYVPALGEYADVATYLLSFEEQRLDEGSDGDFNDLVVALQFYETQGSLTSPVPVPEASTFAMAGATALAALVGCRLLRRRFVIRS